MVRGSTVQYVNPLSIVNVEHVFFRVHGVFRKPVVFVEADPYSVDDGIAAHVGFGNRNGDVRLSFRGVLAEGDALASALGLHQNSRTWRDRIAA